MVKKKATKRSTRKKKKPGFNILEKVKSVVFSSQGLPILLTFSVIGVLFVLFRMKGVELNYKITNMNKDIEKVTLEGKELKAKKARLLSVKNLSKIARKYDLKQPKQSQIIVIP